jgi:hypothetical protein
MRMAAIVLTGVLALGGCGGDDTFGRMREGIAARAADPMYAITTTSIPAPGGRVPVVGDAAVDFHMGLIAEAQYEVVREAVLVVRAEMGVTDPLSVFIDADPALAVDRAPDYVVVDRATLDTAGDDLELFVTVARETALVAQEVLVRNSLLPGDTPPGVEAPWWLRHGQAELLAWQLAGPQLDLIDMWAFHRLELVDAALTTDLALEALELDPAAEGSSDPVAASALATLAVDWLAAGIESSMLHRDLWRAVALDGWEVACGSVFGTSPEELYAAFAGWRADGFPG